MDGMGRNRADKPYQRTGHNGWWVTVYNENGRRRRLKAGDTYEDAVVYRAAYVANVASIKAGHISRRQVEVAEAAKSSVEKVVGAYVAELEKTASAGHVKESRRVIARFVDDAKIYSLADITSPIVRRWLKTQRSQKHGLAYVRAFCRWCIDHHKMSDDPTLGISVKVEPQRPARAMSVAELQALADACPCPKRKTRYLLGARQGLRCEESFRLTWGHIDFKAGWIRLTAEITKMKRNDDLPLDPAVRDALIAIRPDIVHAGARIFSTEITRITWLKDLGRAGIITITGHLEPWFDEHGKRQKADAVLNGYTDERGRTLSRQCLRKTYGTHLASVESNISQVTKLMRHTDPRLTLELYEDARLMDLQGAHAKLPKIKSGTGASSVPENKANTGSA